MIERELEVATAEGEMKTFIYHPTHDGPHPDEMLAMSRLVAGASYVVIPDAGHLSNWDQPDAFNAALEEFLDE